MWTTNLMKLTWIKHKICSCWFHSEEYGSI